MSSIEQLLQNASGNTTILRGTTVAGWTNGPISRGTASILWSCVVTIFVTIYTVIHMNTPVQHQPQWRRIASKFRWTFVALIMPELILHSAVVQFRAARRLVKKLNQIPLNRREVVEDEVRHNVVDTVSSKVEPTRCREDYSLAYGFFVEMGGFIVDTRDISDDVPCVAITAQGVERLAEAGCFLHISDAQIADRSKSSALVRAAAGYPLALLEVHTLAHVGASLLTYTFWWHKPHDIEEPILVDVGDYKPLIALMLMASDQVRGEADPELSNLAYFRHSVVESSRQHNYEQCTHSNRPLSNDPHPRHPERSEIVHPMPPGGSEPSLIRNDEHLICGFGPGSLHKNGLRLSAKDKLRWCLCSHVLMEIDPEEMGLLRDMEKIEMPVLHLEPRGSKFEDTIRTRHSFNRITDELGRLNFRKETIQKHGLIERPKHSRPGIAIKNLKTFFASACLGPILYGGIHIGAFFSEFPQPIEKTLWIAATVITMGNVWIYGICFLLFNPFNCRNISEDARFYQVGPLVALISSFCRMYLVAESFASLRDLPMGVYATTPWLQAIPHL